MYFRYNTNNSLEWQEVDLADVSRQIKEHLIKEYEYNGPYYLYHNAIFQDRLQRFQNFFTNSSIFYSVKSLSNTHILRRIQKYDRFGIDVVSGGEIQRGLEAGFSGDRMVYAGVGKRPDEIALGLKHNIKSFHVESLSEIRQIATVAAEMNVQAPLALRLNPDISVNTHHYIITGNESSKFGISAQEFNEALKIISNTPQLQLKGLQLHLGSQIMEVEPYIKGLAFLERKAQIVAQAGVTLEYLSLGGGFGIDYKAAAGESAINEFPLEELAEKINQSSSNYRIDFEPGRFISAYSGILVARVLYLKEKEGFEIVITDAGMNDLLRPSLYSAYHPVLPFIRREELKLYDVAGPICESADFFIKQERLTRLHEGDYLAILHAGAYGSSMASNYNSRPFLPEVIFEEGKFQVIRRPQRPEDLFYLEK